MGRLFCRHIATLVAVVLTASTASAALIFATEDFAVRRNSGTPTVEPSLHSKFTTNTATTNRFLMLRFDSSLFGASATAASFEITAINVASSWDIATNGSFQVYGVNDGDAEDEAITSTYNPSAAGAIFNAANNYPHLNLSQVTNLGSFTANIGATSTFNAAALLSFIQADTNGIVTLIVSRNSTGNNSVFNDNTTLTPPTLSVVPEPSSLALLSLGGVGLLGFVRRFKRASKA